ncbi:hypothetical protein [Methanoculleus sp.]|uniref:hypothetical protein n=1 Tax=Methanoculleus sp. TaxID=90427 RepID=UPI0025CF2063|nr:hypothetical protein [Methanoculleus sp.]MCK9318398.1 hypothetical protein [Methanoculleus sp.]MDD2254438.1 hypothetical protein [Methanoculleus sp.]MDD2786761.1 hypothetical protein [Methanoculleus sp.]MDD3216884.1 hypothetical protein [Methanoculleus sp.]MDD4314950.1 hypothetical protein [Methanoculleus sp.]
MKHLHVILILCLLLLPAAAAETPRPAESPVEAPVDRLEIDDAVKQASPYYYVMLVGTDDERENLLGYIDRSPRSAEEKEAMKESLGEIWQRYPVVHETEGSVTRIGFDPTAGENPVLTDEENALLADISRAMAEAFAATPTGTQATWYDLSVWLIKTDGQGNEVWNRTYPGGDSADVAAVLQADDGGYLIAGNTGFRDALLIRTDAAGNEVWRKTYGGPDWDTVRAMVAAGDGTYVVAGSTGWTPEKDTRSAWLFEVAPDGREVWSRTFPGDGLFSTVDRTGDGGFILGGNRHIGTDDAWLVRVDRDGREEWSRSIGGNASGIVDGVISTPVDGGYLAAVRNPWETARFGTVPIRVFKTDPTGETLWTRTVDELDGGTRAVLLEVPGGGAVGYLVAGGAIRPGSDLPGPCLIMTGGTGSVAWTVMPEIPGGALLVTSAVASSPGRYAFTGAVYAGGPHDGWLVLLDHTGNVTAARSFGGDATDDISALAATDDGGYVLAGTTRSFGENGWTAPAQAPGFGALAAMAACGIGVLCRGVRRG